MITDSFTPESGIGVKLELMQVALSQAILAGTAPDVVMTIARGRPVNLAARGALVDLTDMEGIQEILAEYPPSATLPYTYNGRLYGRPVTMDFHMLFYRTDIFEEFGLSVPQTWDDVYAMLPILQRNNMEIGIPYTTTTSMSTPDDGIGAKDIFATRILQNGRQLRILLDDQAILDVFREWTRLYCTKR